MLARRLAIFPAGATLAAAEQVCSDITLKEEPPITGQTFTADTLTRADVLPALSGLVGKSILTMAQPPHGSVPRYRMLETVRAYGLERLAQAGEETLVRNAGDLAHARVDLDRADLSAAERGAKVNIDRWVTFLRAELDWLAGDFAAVARCCSGLLAVIQDDRAIWWESLRARVRSRLARAVLERGDASGCGDLLAAALDASAAWTDHPGLAVVLDATACYALHPGAAELRPGAAELTARLLGAAHAIRGAFDESSPDAPRARAAASARLGSAAFDAAYRSTADLGYETAIGLAREALSASIAFRDA